MRCGVVLPGVGVPVKAVPPESGPLCKYHYLTTTCLMGNWMKDTVDHNSHLLVIRRRREPRRRKPQLNYHPTHRPKYGWNGDAARALPIFAGT